MFRYISLELLSGTWCSLEPPFSMFTGTAQVLYLFIPLPPVPAANGSFQSQGGSNGPIKTPLGCTIIIHDKLQMKNKANLPELWWVGWIAWLTWVGFVRCINFDELCWVASLGWVAFSCSNLSLRVFFPPPRLQWFPNEWKCCWRLVVVVPWWIILWCRIVTKK